jgi:hypothetical protein
MKDGMDQCPADAAVTVGERMNGLELSVGDRCLHQRTQVVTGHESNHIVHRR